MALVAAAVFVTGALWRFPHWQVAHSKGLTSENQFERENEARRTLAQIVGGIFLLAGLYSSVETLTTAREGQITDRFAKAIEQLGDTKLAVRLGGIYALERIAKDSEKDHWTTIEVLTSYVREISPLKEGKQPVSKIQSDPKRPKLAADIQAILTVISRRTRTPARELATGYAWGPQRLDLSKTDLSGAILIAAHLEEVVIMEANLTGADLMKAHLERAYAFSANLRRARLVDSYLDGALFGGADFEDADLGGASMAGVELGGATITVPQLCKTKTLHRAKLDELLMAQVKQECPLVLEMPR